MNKKNIMPANFSFMTDEQVRKIFKEEVQKLLAELDQGDSLSDSSPKVVDIDGLIEARPFIGSKVTVYRKVSKGEIPHSKQGKRLIFDLNEIDKWLLSNNVKTNMEVDAEANAYLRRKQRKRGL